MIVSVLKNRVISHNARKMRKECLQVFDYFRGVFSSSHESLINGDFHRNDLANSAIIFFFLFLPHQSSSRDHHQSGSICEVILLETSNRTLSVQRLSILRGKPLTRRNARLNLPTKSFPLTKPSNHIVQTIFFSLCQFPSELAINRILSVLGAQYRPKVGVLALAISQFSISLYINFYV